MEEIWFDFPLIGPYARFSTFSILIPTYRNYVRSENPVQIEREEWFLWLRPFRQLNVLPNGNWLWFRVSSLFCLSSRDLPSVLVHSHLSSDFSNPSKSPNPPNSTKSRKSFGSDSSRSFPHSVQFACKLYLYSNNVWFPSCKLHCKLMKGMLFSRDH